MSDTSGGASGPAEGSDFVPEATVGEYTWEDFLREFGHVNAAKSLSQAIERRPEPRSGGVLSGFGPVEQRSTGRAPTAEEWETIAIDPATFLGWHPTDFPDRVRDGAIHGEYILRTLNEWLRETPVRRGQYSWEHFKLEYHYDERGLRPREADGAVVPFEPEAYLGFDPDDTEAVIEAAVSRAETVSTIEAERTVNVDPELDEDAFFADVHGHTTVSNRYDLEQAVEMEQKPFLMEVERYWVDKPHAFVIIFHSVRENEKKYYLVGPHLNTTESRLKEYLTGKLRTTIKYADEVVVRASIDRRRGIISRELSRLLARYGLYGEADTTAPGLRDRVNKLLGRESPSEPVEPTRIEGLAARPMPAVLEEEATTLSEYQVAKLRYLLNRDFVGYGRIDGIKHDVSVEDISSDGYDSPVFVYHSEYEQLITNVSHGRSELDRFVIKLAQRSGKSISKRHPQVDATLPDGSRAQLTLGYEVSDHGTNYTIRQFNDVPFTPVDLINWGTFALEELVFLWLAIENGKSVLFAGGTASGKTTSLNAVSLFVPSSSKIVSIEDTREVELPQRNWIASITRPAFSNDDEGDIDEFDLLEAALRQRPEYILMGEVRGEEGRTLFQVMSTGHTTLTTFHADSVGEVLKRFTTDPINVSKTMFTALDVVSVQTQTRAHGRKIRRNKVITEINRYDSERDEINVRDIHKWDPESDSFKNVSGSRLLEEIKFDRGWSQTELEREMQKRRAVLAYLVTSGLSEYAEVAATIQAFINDPDAVLGLIARGELDDGLADLQNLESILVETNPEKEALVPRPEPDPETLEEAEQILDEAGPLFEDYHDHRPIPLSEALPAVEAAGGVVAQADGGCWTFSEPTHSRADEVGGAELEFGDGTSHDR